MNPSVRIPDFFRKTIVALVLAIMTVFLTAGELPYDESTILLLHFNDSLNGTEGEMPLVATGVLLEPGLFGNGLRIHRGASAFSGDSVWYSVPDEFNSAEGTIEFWIQPKWVGQEIYSLQIFNLSDIRIQINTPGCISFVMLMDDNESGYYVVQNWQSNEWHHIAATWKIGGHQYLYIDGVEVMDNLATGKDLLSNVPDHFTIGAPYPSDNAEAVIDELRLSNKQRPAAEISQTVLASEMQIASLCLEPDSIRLQPGWFYPLIIAAETNLGASRLPGSLFAWQIDNESIASVGEDGILTAISSGHTTFRGSYNDTLTFEGFLKVDMIFHIPDESEIDPYLATPAENFIYELPVAIVNYYPLRDAQYLEHWDNFPLDTVKYRNNVYYHRLKFMLEEGSRYHGYKNPAANPSMGVRVVKIINIYEHMPMSKTLCGWNPDNHYPDYHKIFGRINAEYLVNELGVKEFWIWYDNYRINGIGYELPESNMSSPVTGDISNSGRLPNDLPVYGHFYTVYQGLHHRLGNVHAHGHQIESMLTHVNELQDGNIDLFIRKFCGMDETDTWITGRCGWTHMPPNIASDYIYDDTTMVMSDCMDWHPEGGVQSPVNVATWRDIDYPWPQSCVYWSAPPYCLDFSRAENHFYIFWRNNIPGYQNNIVFDDSTKVMNNWWEFVANWDEAMLAGKGLYTNIQTGIWEKSRPFEFKLQPPYPNPFNVATVIEYQLGRDSQTTIGVFNLLGQQVITLVNEHQTAGHYRIAWDTEYFGGRPLANGIYLIRIEARNSHKDFIQNQKVVLLK